VCEASEKTECETEAMEERWWAAEGVAGCEVHAIAYEAGVVDQVAE
jgi:hypothetical protein